MIGATAFVLKSLNLKVEDGNDRNMGRLSCRRPRLPSGRYNLWPVAEDRRTRAGNPGAYAVA